MKLYIGNKNYSTWSLRAWLMLDKSDIKFEEVKLTLGTEAFYDGLKRIDPMVINLAKLMGANTFSMLIKIRIPFALPQLSSGLKLAAAFAPMGAVIGEWVGSSKGLGYLMLYASGRVQIDLMFASIIILAFFTILLYNSVSFITNYLTKWDPKSYIN